MLVLVCSLAAGSASAQEGTVRRPDVRTTDPLMLRVDSLYAEGKQRESLELLRGHLGHARTDYLTWVLAARAALVLGYADADPDSAKAWLHRAISYGEEAQALDSAGENGRYVTLAAVGQLALIESPVESARLGRRVERDALALLAIDSLHAGAHDALGKLYLQVARLSRLQRFIARAWLGGDLIGRASWTAAEWHLRRAVALQPQRNFYHLDLGTLLYLRGRLDEARGELQQALDVPLETPQQVGFRTQARAFLDKIDGHDRNRPTP